MRALIQRVIKANVEIDEILYQRLIEVFNIYFSNDE